MRPVKKAGRGERFLCFSANRSTVGSAAAFGQPQAGIPRVQAWLWSVLAMVILVVGLQAGKPTACGQHTASPSAAPVAPGGADVGPAWQLWRSQTTGNEYRVRVEKGVFRAEWVNVPMDWAKQGAYLRTECRRMGGKWVGTSVAHLPCTSGEGQNARIAKWCDLKTQTEIDSITSQRVAGRGQGASKIDCEQCKVVETSWSPFVWTRSR